VHHPLAFWSVSYLLDFLYGAATHPSTAKTVSSIYDVAPFLGDIAKFSYYLNLLGLIFAVPAVMSGGQQLMQMIKKQDLAAKFEKSQNKSATAQKMHPKMKLGFAHAAMNDACVAASVYTWWTRSTNPGYAPDELHLIISAVSFLLLSTAGWLGAAMVYEHGVGVARAPAAKGAKAL
jgi:uncharacterized membrane protein